MRGSMGLADREWYREEKPEEPRRRGIFGALVILAVMAGLAIAGGALSVIRGKQPTFEGEKRTLLGATKVSLLPGLPP
jgi:hypothetical protein